MHGIAVAFGLGGVIQWGMVTLVGRRDLYISLETNHRSAFARDDLIHSRPRHISILFSWKLYHAKHIAELPVMLALAGHTHVATSQLAS